MVGLWRIGALGESEMERAIHHASQNADDVHAIVEVLKNPDLDLGFTDRVLLAQFLAGDYRRPRGRPRKADRVGVRALPQVANTSAQEAARLARQDMAGARAEGRRVRGIKTETIERRAQEFDVDPEMVWNAYRRGRARENT